MMNGYFLILLFIGVALINTSCRKESVDDFSPIVSIQYPNYYENFTVGNSIPVRGTVTDDKNISSLSISLRDRNNIIVSQTIVKTPNTTEFNFSEVLSVEDINLISGLYYLKVSAFDGTNKTDEYIHILLKSAPILRKGIFVYSNTGSFTQITKLDSLYNSSGFITTNGDFLNGGVNSKNQQVLSTGSFSGGLESYDINTNANLWEVNNTNSGLPMFTSFLIQDDNVFVGYQNGEIKGYNRFGSESFQAMSLTNSYPIFLFQYSQQMMLTVQKEKISGMKRIVSYYTTGTYKNNLVFNEEVVSMFLYNMDEVVIFSNQSNQGKISIYNLQTNSTWQAFSVGSGEISSATEVLYRKYLYTLQGDIYLLDFSTNSNSLFLSGLNAKQIKFDAVKNELAVVNGTSLKIIDYSTKVIKKTYNHNDSIRAIDFWYNR